MKFSAESTAGTVNSGDYSWLVVYFYPRDNTPGCTTEGHDFNAAYKSFKDCGAEIFGVSADSMASHNKFRDKQGYEFPLISDAEEKLCKQFEVLKKKNMYGREYMGIERSTFILDPKGSIVREWRKVKVAGHVDEVLSALSELTR